MKVAVMQPYLFPYLGYYQLVHCSDVFVLYDDVTFIKRGYINRNNILVNGQASRVTIPVPGASQNKLIKDLEFSEEISKILKTFKHSYSHAPFFKDIYALIERVLKYPKRDITTICQIGITEVFEHLGISKKIIRSSDLDYNRDLPAADRLMEICDQFGSSDYVNSIGGQKLYSKEYFAEKGKTLSFLQMNDVSYPQNTSHFIPYLSMIDVLMWCDKPSVRELLQQYKLV